MVNRRTLVLFLMALSIVVGLGGFLANSTVALEDPDVKPTGGGTGGGCPATCTYCCETDCGCSAAPAGYRLQSSCGCSSIDCQRSCTYKPIQ